MEKKFAMRPGMVQSVASNGVAVPPQSGVARLPGVMARVGMSRSWIYASVKAGTFPKPVNLGPRAVGWLLDESETFIEAQATNRNDLTATKQEEQ